jgi:predicted house-cleaning NTP pyrophosphatase (Maf/HAM1 superfamily)
MNKKSLVVTANSISEAFKRILENPKNKEAAREAIKNIIDRAR